MHVAKTRLFAAALFLGACAELSVNEADVRVALQDLREGCVGNSLAFLQGASDRLAPFTAATSLGGMLATAAETGCGLAPGAEEGVYVLTCPAAGTVMEAQMRYYAGGVPLPGPAGADLLEATLSFDGLHLWGEGRLAFAMGSDLAVTGGIEADTADGCRVVLDVDMLGRLLADSAAGALTLHYVSGGIDIEATQTLHGTVTGAAALSGRTAVVVLHAAGVSSQGAVDV